MHCLLRNTVSINLQGSHWGPRVSSSSLFIVNTWHTRVINPPAESHFQPVSENPACYTLTICRLTGWLACVALTDLCHCHCRCMWLELRAHKHSWAIKVLYSFAFVPVFSKLCHKATTGWVLSQSPLAGWFVVNVWLTQVCFQMGPASLGLWHEELQGLVWFSWQTNKQNKDK